jgi:hypothetical protein
MILHISFKVFFYNDEHKVKKAMRYVLPLIVLLITAANGYAAERSVRYGDYPEGDGAYGICRVSMGPKEAEIAIEKYFAARGLQATNMRHRDRFVVADIYRDNRLYDKILFDRKTGRIRSIN